MSETIRTSDLRVGNITSSALHVLLDEPTAKDAKAGEVFSVGARTYLSECNMERRLGRPLSDDVQARPLSWGMLVEKRAFNLLGFEYKECSQETIVHPRYAYWAGSPDGQKFDDAGDTLAEVKCPQTLKSFCQLADCIKEGLSGIEIMAAIRVAHKDGDKFYWQIVSNAILTNSKFSELVIYMPYKSELEAIRELARQYDGPDQYRFKWIDNASDEELPYIIEGGYYKNLNIIRFEVPQGDKELLTSRILAAGKLLIPMPEKATVSA